MAPAAQSQRNAAEILGQAVKPPERIAIGSRGMASQLPRDYSLPGLRQSRRRDNLPATAGRHRDQSSPSPGRHQGDRHTKLRSRGRTKDPARKQDCRSRFPDPESLAGLAGVAPVTRRSGTRISHGFRWAVNRQLRDAVLRLRRRLPARQPVGSGHLRRGPRPRQGPPARRPHHRPRLDLCHLALLARQRRLRPRQAQRPAEHPGPAAGWRGRGRRPRGHPVTAAVSAALRACAAGIYPDEAARDRADHRAAAGRGAPRRAPARRRPGRGSGGQGRPPRGAFPRAVRLRCSRGRDRGDPGGRPGLRDEDDLHHRTGRRGPPGRGRRRGVLAPAGRVRPRRVRRGATRRRAGRRSIPSSSS